LTVLIVLIVLAPLVDFVAAAYLWWLYLGDKERSWVLRTLTVGATLQTVAATYIAILGADALSPAFQLHLPPELIAIAILVLQAGPPYLAVEVARRRR
jgi:hypothetical protein